MARVFNGSSQYLSASSTLLTNEPIDFVLSVNSDSVTVGQVALSLGNNGASGFIIVSLEGTIGGDPIRILKQSDAAANGFASSAAYSASTWYNLGATLISDTSRAIYLNGTKTADTTNVADPTPDFITIGALRRSSVSAYMDGSIAETYILDANMSDANHAVVALGYSPIWSYPIGNVRGWYPLQNDNNNRMAGGYPDLTATGSPTDAIHPFNVIYPKINGVITL